MINLAEQRQQQQRSAARDRPFGLISRARITNVRLRETGFSWPRLVLIMHTVADKSLGLDK